MTRAGDVYLAASSHPQTLHAMVSQAASSIERRPVLVAVSHVSTGGQHAGRMTHFFERSIDRVEVTRFSVAGERDAMPPGEARAVLERADLVFLGGGDPVEGARLLVAAGADAWLRDAHARGVPCMGVSAGAILLGAWWASWPDSPPAGAAHEGGELVRCTGAVPDLVVDCHAEEDDWNELRIVRAMLRDRLGEGAVLPRFLGLPSGTGIIVSPGGPYRSVGGEPVTI